MAYQKEKPTVAQIRKWVKALRSGEYEQAKWFLQNKNGYCCLGVACKIFVPAKKQELDSRGALYGANPNEQSASPRWLKFINGDFYSMTNVHLSTMNDDDRGFTFDEIADCLEAVYIHKVLAK
ncbi:hypothetical protein D3C87_125320 [compost metagenome]